MSKTAGSGTTARPGAQAPKRDAAPGKRDPNAARREANVARTQEFFRGLVSEMRRVTWPTRDEWVAATLLTVGLVVVIAAYTYALDQGFGALIGLVHK